MNELRKSVDKMKSGETGLLERLAEESKVICLRHSCRRMKLRLVSNVAGVYVFFSFVKVEISRAIVRVIHTL